MEMPPGGHRCIMSVSLIHFQSQMAVGNSNANSNAINHHTNQFSS